MWWARVTLRKLSWLVIVRSWMRRWNVVMLWYDLTIFIFRKLSFKIVKTTCQFQEFSNHTQQKQRSPSRRSPRMSPSDQPWAGIEFHDGSSGGVRTYIYPGICWVHPLSKKVLNRIVTTHGLKILNANRTRHTFVYQFFSCYFLEYLIWSLFLSNLKDQI